jgi:hypothetical protein
MTADRLNYTQPVMYDELIDSELVRELLNHSHHYSFKGIFVEARTLVKP